MCGKRIWPLHSGLELLLAHLGLGGVLWRGDTLGNSDFSAHGAAPGHLGVYREGSCGSLEKGGPAPSSAPHSCPPLPGGEAQLTQAAPALPDVLGAPPWTGICFSLGMGWSPKQLFILAGCAEILLERDQGERKVGIKWRRG